MQKTLSTLKDKINNALVVDRENHIYRCHRSIFTDQQLFDFEMKNNHSPLYILKLDKINIEEAIFTEEHCEFKKEDYNNPVFDEKLLFLNIIYSKIENRTKEILGII